VYIADCIRLAYHPLKTSTPGKYIVDTVGDNMRYDPYRGSYYRLVANTSLASRKKTYATL
jgi:hypothetical protein